jgi:hypothetical protein
MSLTSGTGTAAALAIRTRQTSLGRSMCACLVGRGVRPWVIGPHLSTCGWLRLTAATAKNDCQERYCCSGARRTQATPSHGSRIDRRSAEGNLRSGVIPHRWPKRECAHERREPRGCLVGVCRWPRSPIPAARGLRNRRDRIPADLTPANTLPGDTAQVPQPNCRISPLRVSSLGTRSRLQSLASPSYLWAASSSSLGRDTTRSQTR